MRLLMPYDNAVMVFMGAGDIEKYEFAYEKEHSTSYRFDLMSI